MKKYIYYTILIASFLSVFSCEPKKSIDRNLPVSISFENQINNFVANGFTEVILKIEDLNTDYNNSELLITLPDSAGKFLNNTKSFTKKLSDEDFSVPFIVSKTPGIYSIKFEIIGNDIILPNYLEFKLSEQLFIKAENITLSSNSVLADGSSNITINLEADETILNDLLTFEIYGKNGGKFQNNNAKISRKINNENFLETFTVSEVAGSYFIKTYRTNSPNFYDTIYLPFELTPINSPNKILSSSISSISNPFIADNESTASISLEISNLDNNEAKNVEMTILSNTAKFIINGMNDLTANITGNISYSTLIKTTQNADDIIVKLDFEGQISYLNITNNKSFPDEIIISPNSYQISSSVSSSFIGKVFVNKLNGLVSEEVSISLEAFQGANQVGNFNEVFYKTTISNYIDFTFTNSNILDTLQNLKLKASVTDDNGTTIIDEVFITVAP